MQFVADTTRVVAGSGDGDDQRLGACTGRSFQNIVQATIWKNMKLVQYNGMGVESMLCVGFGRYGLVEAVFVVDAVAQNLAVA